jgi:hypothetical protein
MKNQIKIYRSPLARVFMATHPRAGEPTGFAEKIKAGIKLHTIRSINPASKAANWGKKIGKMDNSFAIIHFTSFRY